jgi:hypothetical protein
MSERRIFPPLDNSWRKISRTQLRFCAALRPEPASGDISGEDVAHNWLIDNLSYVFGYE